MAGVIATIPKFQFSANGVPMVGGTLDTYIAGSTTPATTWQDSALTIANTNPISLDARGECVLWLDPAVVYKFVLKNAPSNGGVVQWTQDDISSTAALTTALRADMAASSGSGLIGYSAVNTYPEGTAGAAIKAASATLSTLSSAVLNNLYPPATGGTDTRGVDLNFITAKGAIHYGGSDPLPTNDERNYWRGFVNKNAWGTPANAGLYSTAFNRNGMSVGTYSNTFGHDCIAMGTASVAGGAGSATGDPDDPLNAVYAFNGYCAFAWGKNVLALGEKSYSLGEEGKSNSRASGTLGYLNITRKSLISDPGGVASDGIGAIAAGYGNTAAGDGAVALGKNVTAYSGSQLFGSGINTGNPLVNPNAGIVGMGANVVKPTLYCLPGDGTVGDTGRTISRGSLTFTMDDVSPGQEAVRHSAILTNGGAGGYAGWQVYLLKAGALTPAFISDGVTLSFAPSTDNAQTLGTAANRWSVVYAGTAAISTSDERLKQQITTDLAPELRAWAKVKFSKFKFNDAVAAKGDKARWHFGVIAQEVKAAFEAEGLDPFAFGILCYDEWDEQPEVKDAQGAITTPYRAAGNRYGVRYEEALALECAYLRSTLSLPSQPATQPAQAGFFTPGRGD